MILYLRPVLNMHTFLRKTHMSVLAQEGLDVSVLSVLWGNISEQVRGKPSLLFLATIYIRYATQSQVARNAEMFEMCC